MIEFDRDEVLERAREIATHFTQSILPYGRPDSRKTPFASSGQFICGRLHSPPILAETLYAVYGVTGDAVFLNAADLFVTFVLAVVRNPVGDGEDWYRDTVLGPDAPPERIRECRELMSRSWELGMALSCYSEFKTTHPEETCFDSKAEALYRWLQDYRWDHSSVFRLGYVKGDFPDGGFADDLCHVGRGLAKYYQVCGKQAVLDDAVALAEHFLTPFEPGTDTGLFSEDLGTWVIGPWPIVGFEHSDDLPANQAGWGYSARDATDFLLRLYPLLDEALQGRVTDRCVRSLRWQFETCQFDDGALGVFGHDDKWLGMTAGALLNYLALQERGLLGDEDRPFMEERAARSMDWFMAHASVEFAIDRIGYEKVSGRTDDGHKEDAGWLIAWVVQALVALGGR
ncbi:MAG: hypothetical protein HQ559_15205 [Lentisphaerae bacterium]|nr:hypothetical protein [Lentisphaerota bacterium]